MGSAADARTSGRPTSSTSSSDDMGWSDTAFYGAPISWGMKAMNIPSRGVVAAGVLDCAVSSRPRAQVPSDLQHAMQAQARTFPYSATRADQGLWGSAVRRFIEGREWVLEVWVRQDGAWRGAASQMNVVKGVTSRMLWASAQRISVNDPTSLAHSLAILESTTKRGPENWAFYTLVRKRGFSVASYVRCRNVTTGPVLLALLAIAQARRSCLVTLSPKEFVSVPTLSG